MTESKTFILQPLKATPDQLAKLGCCESDPEVVKDYQLKALRIIGSYDTVEGMASFLFGYAIRRGWLTEDQLADAMHYVFLEPDVVVEVAETYKRETDGDYDDEDEDEPEDEDEEDDED